jgi:hypothetical protein
MDKAGTPLAVTTAAPDRGRLAVLAERIDGFGGPVDHRRPVIRLRSVTESKPHSRLGMVDCGNRLLAGARRATGLGEAPPRISLWQS